MSDLIIPRRRFLQGMASLFVAPAIIKASSLMPVKSWVPAWPVPPDARSVTFFSDRVWWLHDSDVTGMFFSDPGDWLNHPKASLIKMSPVTTFIGQGVSKTVARRV